jgi:hypothetical protein
LGGVSFPALSSGGTRSVTLGVNSPPLEIHVGPFREDRRAAQAGKFLDFVERSPGIFLALQALDLLGLRFRDCFRLRWFDG